MRGRRAGRTPASDGPRMVCRGDFFPGTRSHQGITGAPDKRRSALTVLRETQMKVRGDYAEILPAVEGGGTAMLHSAMEAYEKGYSDGKLTAEQMRWQGTPIGDLLKGPYYQPEAAYPAEYEAGFLHAMESAGRSEWRPPQRPERRADGRPTLCNEPGERLDRRGPVSPRGPATVLSESVSDQ